MPKQEDMTFIKFISTLQLYPCTSQGAEDGDVSSEEAGVACWEV